jgi:serine/threonine-protein kinase
MAPDSPALDPTFLAFQSALAGRYSIDREIGRGGMGIVYLAREVHLDRLVAIKLLPPARATDPALREGFLREARLAAKLSHPHIIPIHAVDDAGGFVFYVMAYIDGETLSHRVRTRGPLTASDGVRMLREMAWALGHAHAQGLVHRDVKPDNILLESGSGRVLVADFGIAAAVGDARGEGVNGTPEFMSPEQALGGHVDSRSDIYGLGCTAFYLFSGRLPFEGKSPTEVLAKQVTETPPLLASLGLTVPKKVALLVDRCLAKEPQHRPATAELLAEQLGVALEQRKELPTALRAFAKRNGRWDGSGMLVYSAILMTGSIIASAFFGAAFGFTMLGIGFTVAPAAFFIDAAKRLAAQGFSYDDIAPAFKSEIDQGREERMLEYRSGAGAGSLERILRAVARISALLLPFVMANEGWTLFQPSHRWLIGSALSDTLFFITMPTTILSTAAYLSLAERRRDVSTEFWARVWDGRIGRACFALGKKLLGRRIVGSATTHRATELSLGMAAENLFESLPKETRRSLGDLPQLLHRLQGDAQRLRRRHDDLQEALNQAGDAAAADDYEDIRADRDAIREKLGDAVGALETIRLNLLRLHAGSGSVEGLTTHIGLAVEVSEEVERLLAAQEDVERGLRFPRETATTPV